MKHIICLYVCICVCTLSVFSETAGQTSEAWSAYERERLVSPEAAEKALNGYLETLLAFLDAEHTGQDMVPAVNEALFFLACVRETETFKSLAQQPDMNALVQLQYTVPQFLQGFYAGKNTFAPAVRFILSGQQKEALEKELQLPAGALSAKTDGPSGMYGSVFDAETVRKNLARALGRADVFASVYASSAPAGTEGDGHGALVGLAASIVDDPQVLVVLFSSSRFSAPYEAVRRQYAGDREKLLGILAADGDVFFEEPENVFGTNTWEFAGVPFAVTVRGGNVATPMLSEAEQQMSGMPFFLLTDGGMPEQMCEAEEPLPRKIYRCWGYLQELSGRSASEGFPFSAVMPNDVADACIRFLDDPFLLSCLSNEQAFSLCGTLEQALLSSRYIARANRLSQKKYTGASL